MEMTKEALELIQETAQRAYTPMELPEVDARKKYVALNGEIKEITVAPGLRNHRVTALNSLIEYATAWLAAETVSPQIWVGENAVTLVLDDDDRLDRVVYPLAHSRPYTILRRIDAGTSERTFDQRTFIRLLRVELGLEPELVANFRRLAISQKQGSHSTIDHCAEALGRSIEAQVAGADEIPEEIIACIPVYANLDVSAGYAVQCAVKMDLHGGQIYLRPLPGHVEAAQARATEQIRERIAGALEDVQIPVYCGDPDSQ